MRSEESIWLRCTWTGEWWINSSTNRGRAARIDPSTTTANHQSHGRVEKRPALSRAEYSHTNTLHLCSKSTWNEAVDLNFWFSQVRLTSSPPLPPFSSPRRTNISQLVLSCSFPTAFPCCPTAMFSIELHIRLQPEPKAAAATASVKQCTTAGTPTSHHDPSVSARSDFILSPCSSPCRSSL